MMIKEKQVHQEMKDKKDPQAEDAVIHAVDPEVEVIQGPQEGKEVEVYLAAEADHVQEIAIEEREERDLIQEAPPEVEAEAEVEAEKEDQIAEDILLQEYVQFYKLTF